LKAVPKVGGGKLPMESRNRAWGRQKPYSAWKQRCAATTAVGDFEGTGVTHRDERPKGGVAPRHHGGF
jgi:hypothetical protein